MSREAIRAVLTNPRVLASGRSPLWRDLLLPWIERPAPRAAAHAPWPYAAWWLTRQIAFGDGDADALHDAVGADLGGFIDRYALRVAALAALNRQTWFKAMGRGCERRVFGVVAGNHIPLLYQMRRSRRIVVVGPDGCYAPRLARWLAEQHGSRAHNLLLEGPRALQRTADVSLFWAEGDVLAQPWWPRVSALCEVVETRGVRDVLDDYVGPCDEATAFIHQWFEAENLDPLRAVGIEGSAAFQHAEAQIHTLLSDPRWWTWPWPGGFAELTAVLSEALFTGYVATPPTPEPSDPAFDWSDGIDQVLDLVRERVVRDAWQDCASFSELARRLKVTRQTATRWAERYDLC